MTARKLWEHRVFCCHATVGLSHSATEPQRTQRKTENDLNLLDLCGLRVSVANYLDNPGIPSEFLCLTEQRKLGILSGTSCLELTNGLEGL